jgi:hypothetical protein
MGSGRRTYPGWELGRIWEGREQPDRGPPPGSLASDARPKTCHGHADREVEQTCLSEFLQVLSNQRPYLVQCYDRQDFPRTNNELERSIRALKTQ